MLEANIKPLASTATIHSASLIIALSDICFINSENTFGSLKIGVISLNKIFLVGKSL